MISRRSRLYWRLALWSAAILLALWAAVLIRFVERIPVAGDPNPGVRTDAVVVLTGGRGRIGRGADLLENGKARLLLISGVGLDVTLPDLIPDGRLPADILECCVTLGRVARDTRENSIETAGWAAANRVGSLRLVTADFHMPRSMFEFRRRMPHLEIVPEPVMSENVRLERWWLWPGTATLLAVEYNKYLVARLRAFAEGLWTDP